ncbi:unnamed protein product, partial [Rotaria sp. Silwood2]
MKRQLPEYRDEPSPRRTPHYSAKRAVRGGVAVSYDGLPGGATTTPAAAYPPYSHAGAVSEWERELLAPKTPTAATFYESRHPPSTTSGLLSPEAERRIDDARRDEERRRYEKEKLSDKLRDEQRKEDNRRELEREWDRDYYRKHGYSAKPGENPYSSGARHRNAVSRTVRPGASYYDRYGRFDDERNRAALKIQAAFRGHRF